MAQLFFNNARAVLNVGIDTLATSITLTDVVGLPASLASGDWFLLTIYKDSRRHGEDHEVVKVTSVMDNGDGTLTYDVVRGIEEAAVSHVMGEPVEARMTAGSVARLQGLTDTMQIDYDGAGNIASTSETLSDGRTRTSTFTYDGAGNLSQSVTTVDNVARTENYTYDGAGNLTGVSATETFV